MAKSVSTRTLPLLGTAVSCAAYRSYPAAKADPRVGVVACSESFLTSSGWVRGVGVGTAADGDIVGGFGRGRLGSGEEGSDGGWCRWWVVEVLAPGCDGGGVEDRVIPRFGGLRNQE